MVGKLKQEWLSIEALVYVALLEVEQKMLVIQYGNEVADKKVHFCIPFRFVAQKRNSFTMNRKRKHWYSVSAVFC